MSEHEANRTPDNSAHEAYRAQVKQLVETCLHGIRQYKLPDDAQPPAIVWPANE